MVRVLSVTDTVHISLGVIALHLPHNRALHSEEHSMYVYKYMI